MQAAGKWVMGIVTGGIALGAVLGAAAKPDMKDPPEPWWRLTGAETVIASSDQQFAEAWPQDLNPFTGYRPDLDYEAEAWALPISEHDLAALDEVGFEPLADDLPTVTYGVTAEDVADEAEAVAEDALAAQTIDREPAPGPAPGEVRKSELATAGLY